MSKSSVATPGPAAGTSSSNGPSNAASTDVSQVKDPIDRPIETWYDTARAAWFMLAAKPENKGRTDFTLQELYRIVDENWAKTCGERPKHEKWRISLHRALRSKFVCIPSTRKDAPPDSWAMFNPAYVSRSSGKKKRHSSDKSQSDTTDGPPSKRRRSSRRDDIVDSPVEKMDEIQYTYGTIPEGWLSIPPGPVRLSEKDRAPALTILTESGLEVRGMKGYRSIRATHGTREGNWYFEVEIIPCVGEGNVRLGWSTRRSDVETPVGFDASGHGIRDKTGEYYHEAKLMDYGRPFGAGDVIGCRISLPKLTEKQDKDVTEAEKKWAEYKFVTHGKPPEDRAESLGEEAVVEFTKNGESFGIAAKNLKAGVYYPTISLYKNAVAKANFGPTFKHTPPNGAKPFSEIAPPLPPPTAAKIDGSGEGTATENEAKKISAAPNAAAPTDAKIQTPATENAQAGVVSGNTLTPEKVQEANSASGGGKSENTGDEAVAEKASGNKLTPEAPAADKTAAEASTASNLIAPEKAMSATPTADKGTTDAPAADKSEHATSKVDGASAQVNGDVSVSTKPAEKDTNSMEIEKGEKAS